MGAGVVTAVPLLLFASGARRLTLATLGLIQYVGPTMQLLLGVWLYHEPFGAVRAIGFGLIWAALALYSGHGLLAYWKPTASVRHYPRVSRLANCTASTLPSVTSQPHKAQPCRVCPSQYAPSSAAHSGLSKPSDDTATAGSRRMPRNHSAYASSAPHSDKYPYASPLADTERRQRWLQPPGQRQQAQPAQRQLPEVLCC